MTGSLYLPNVNKFYGVEHCLRWARGSPESGQMVCAGKGEPEMAKISTFAICAGAATFICLTVRLIFIYISDFKLYRGLRGAAHAFHFRKRWKGGDDVHNHHDQILDKVHPKAYLFPRMLENFMITTVIITIA